MRSNRPKTTVSLCIIIYARAYIAVVYTEMNNIKHIHVPTRTREEVGKITDRYSITMGINLYIHNNNNNNILSRVDSACGFPLFVCFLLLLHLFVLIYIYYFLFYFFP